MGRTADRCIHGLGDHSAGRGQVCRRALQVLPDPCGSRASICSRRRRKHVRPRHPADKKPGTLDSERAATHTAHQFDVSIYCDGACEPNPGNAGSGIVVYRAGKLAELWYGLYNPMGTNNTAELNALYHALRMAEAEIKAGNTVEVCSDSAYSINCIRSWAPSWEKKGWKKPGGEIKNLEIIQDCYAIYRRIEKKLKLTHVAAHVGTEGNELADRMAMLAVQRKEKKLRLYQEKIDIPTLLKMRAGSAASIGTVTIAIGRNGHAQPRRLIVRTALLS